MDNKVGYVATDQGSIDLTSQIAVSFSARPVYSGWGNAKKIVRYCYYLKEKCSQTLPFALAMGRYNPESIKLFMNCHR